MIDKEFDTVQNNMFSDGDYRSWNNNGIVLLPSPDYD